MRPVPAFLEDLRKPGGTELEREAADVIEAILDRTKYFAPGEPLHGRPLTRRASGLLEALCVHGVGHPIPGSIKWLEFNTGRDGWGIHGCDGCCQGGE